MNKHGQTLIIFVILIPIIISILALVVDIGLYTYEITRTKGIIDTAIEEYFLSYDERKIAEILKMNEIPIDNLKTTIENEKVDISLEYSISSIFGKLIRIEKYDIIIKRTGIKENNYLIKKDRKE